MSKQKDESIYRKGWDDGFAKGAAAARFQMEAENAKLRELVRDMFYAVHPVDREKFLTNVVELGVGVDA